ncbi:MAG: heavy-metal-associated domain-containing protein [Atopobiaceae bacterium]|nr:heavy-metal-associated domain-containing protein [Atopobiaceae bacterium]MBQ6651229.1 heavy-metal-associated domain-containing protein [Atopobiaceae bacterium]
MIQTTIGIDGMMCEMCEAHINDAIRKNFQVKSARANRRKRQCVVVSEDELDHDRIRSVIAETGYDLLSISSEPYQKKGFLSLF